MIIGIDIGSTITKAVSIEAGTIRNMIKTKAEDAVSSAAGAFGKLTVESGISISAVQRIMATGVGASRLPESLFDIPAEKVDEIKAIGMGGMFLSGKENIIITNIGTGTAIIEARKEKITHLGGSGVGGGTILGLGKKLLGMSHFSDIMALAETGSIRPVDLLVEDIIETNLSFLAPESTASNFGKMLDTAGNEDVALGIVSMVYQVIGMISVFAARSRNIDQVVVTGNGSKNPIGKKILEEITKMHSIFFEYPEDAEYTTAIGAGLS